MADWYPSTRAGRLAMAQNWAKILSESTQNDKGDAVQKFVLWGIPPETLADFMAAFDKARTAFTAAQNDELRTRPITEACRAAFEGLDKIMRRIKDYYFKVPPLSTSDIISLGLKVRDSTYTKHGPPEGIPMATVSNPLPGTVRLVITPYNAESGHDENANHLCIRWGVFGFGDTQPQVATDLPETRTTRRKIERFIFTPPDKGKRVWFSLRYENNKGEAGPWSPLIEGIVT